jgi:hydrogenase nickel incorporation protein HypA/HybF
MHEFSLAVEVIKLAEHEAEKAMAESIQEITIEVGYLSGVEADAFESALAMLARESALNKALIKIIRTPGTGRCNSCNFEFEMKQRMETCPKCQAFPSEVKGGQEFMVRSMVIE